MMTTVLLVFTAAGQPLHALSTQELGTVSGSVSDAATGAPVPHAVLQIDTLLRTVADSVGTFIFNDVPQGAHQLTIRRTGYATRTVNVDLSSVGFVSLTLALQPVTVELDPLTVEGEATATQRHLAGFEDRRRFGIGHHLTREEFETWNPSHVTDVLRHIPSVRIRPNPGYPFESTRPFIVETMRGVPAINRSDPYAMPECPVHFFLDGVSVGNAGDTDIDNLLSIYQVDAIETYVGAQVPARFHHPDAGCGVIAFWTRQDAPQQRAGGPPVLAGLVGATAGVGFALLSPEGCRTCLIGTDDRLKRAIGNAVIFGLAGVAVSWLFFRSDEPVVAVRPVGAGGYGIAASVRLGLN